MIDWLIISYLTITGFCILISNNATIKQIKWRFIYVRVLFIVILLITKKALIYSPFLFIDTWYGFVAIPILYWEMAFLATLFHPEPLDSQLILFEHKLFKTQPSITLMEQLNNLYLSEFLHFSYLMYYPILIVLPLYFYIVGQDKNYEFALFAELITFCLCMLTCIFCPIAGPRYFYQKADGSLSDGFFFKICHWILSTHSSKGTAFPSSHVAMATVVFLIAFHLGTLWAWAIFPFSLGIIFGVVYCRFHYALDSILGLIYGVVGFVLTYLMIC